MRYTRIPGERDRGRISIFHFLEQNLHLGGSEKMGPPQLLTLAPGIFSSCFGGRTTRNDRPQVIFGARVFSRRDGHVTSMRIA